MVRDLLQAARLVPVLTIRREADAVPLARALVEGVSACLK
jgi:2-keto-3-deoxy-6-phosphogluconate aldolase